MLVIAIGVGAPCFADEFMATKPAERVAYWVKRQNEMTALLKDNKNISSARLVFLGDSITDMWLVGADPGNPAKKHGLAIWNESFGGGLPINRAIDLGLSGDRTENLLYRLLSKESGGLGELDAPGLDPDIVILMIGINNTWAAEDPVVESVFSGVQAVVKAVHEHKPNATIVLESLLPTQEEVRNRDIVIPVNERLVEMSKKHDVSEYTVFLDLYPLFVDSTGKERSELYVDGVHPNESGYRVWRDRLLPYLDQIRSMRIATATRSHLPQ